MKSTQKQILVRICKKCKRGLLFLTLSFLICLFLTSPTSALSFQDNNQGFWFDDFSDTSGLDSQNNIKIDNGIIKLDTISNGWTQTKWKGGPGQITWSNPTKFFSSTNINYSAQGKIKLASCYLSIPMPPGLLVLSRSISRSVIRPKPTVPPSIIPPWPPRSPRKIYLSPGILISSIYDAQTEVRWQTINWSAEIPDGTDIVIEISTDGGVSFEQVVNGQNLETLATISNSSQTIIYRAILSTTVNTRTPVLYDITFSYSQYKTSGEATSITFSPIWASEVEKGKWDQVKFKHNLNSQTITYQVLDQEGNLIPDSALLGNSSGFASSPINISSLDPDIYPGLKLKANLSTNNTSLSPSLEEWSVGWIQARAGEDQTVTLDETATFDASLSIGTSLTYDWDWQDDGTYDALDIGPNPSHQYDQAGIYKARVKITSPSGATDTNTVSITVNPISSSDSSAEDSDSSQTQTDKSETTIQDPKDLQSEKNEIQDLKNNPQPKENKILEANPQPTKNLDFSLDPTNKSQTRVQGQKSISYLEEDKVQEIQPQSTSENSTRPIPNNKALNSTNKSNPFKDLRLILLLILATLIMSLVLLKFVSAKQKQNV